MTYSEKLTVSEEYAEKTRQRIQRLTRIDEETGCWIWTKYRSPDGYGYMGYNGGVFGVHRVSFWVYNGAIPEGLEVCHKCDKPGCANPTHLFVGTHADNIRDCAAKGRLNLCKMKRTGENNPACSISDALIFKINEMLSAGYRGCEIATSLNVGQSSVSRVKHGFRLNDSYGKSEG